MCVSTCSNLGWHRVGPYSVRVCSAIYSTLLYTPYLHSTFKVAHFYIVLLAREHIVGERASPEHLLWAGGLFLLDHLLLG